MHQTALPQTAQKGGGLSKHPVQSLAQRQSLAGP
jgi:hypothetical protein